MSSVFAKIIAGEIPCYKIYEDEKTLVFLDIAPENRGHMLAVPKIEVDKVYELPDDYYTALWETVRKVCRRVEEVTGRRAIIKVIGVDVPHAHVHILPFDETWQQDRVLKFSEEEMRGICEELRF